MVILLMNERICFAYINEPRTQTLGKFTHTHARTRARAHTPRYRSRYVQQVASVMLHSVDVLKVGEMLGPCTSVFC